MIRVTGDRVLVQLPPKVDEVVSDGGIVLVRDPDAIRLPSRGIVVGLGEKSDMVSLDDVLACWDECERLLIIDWRAALATLKPAPFDVALGDCVLFPTSAGEQCSRASVGNACSSGRAQR